MSALRQFRFVALAEGVSFLVLLFIAMPMKYLLDLPLAVRVVGSVHGALFVAFVLALVRVSFVQRWAAPRSLLAFVSSIVPFGTFVFDRSVARELAAAAEDAAVSGP